MITEKLEVSYYLPGQPPARVLIDPSELVTFLKLLNGLAPSNSNRRPVEVKLIRAS